MCVCVSFFVYMRMKTFILPQHANIDVLREMLGDFRRRLDEKTTNLSMIVDMNSQLDSMQRNDSQSDTENSFPYIIYWPYTNDEYSTKRCLYATDATTPSAAYHMVYITTLLKLIHPVEHRFRKCACIDHTQKLILRREEFIYPQFVRILYKRLVVPIITDNTPLTVASATHSVTSESLQCKIRIDKTASFLTNVCFPL